MKSAWFSCIGLSGRRDKSGFRGPREVRAGDKGPLENVMACVKGLGRWREARLSKAGVPNQWAVAHYWATASWPAGRGNGWLWTHVDVHIPPAHVSANSPVYTCACAHMGLLALGRCAWPVCTCVNRSTSAAPVHAALFACAHVRTNLETALFPSGP